MSDKILHREEAKTLYDSLVAANNIFVRDFRLGFIQSRPTNLMIDSSGPLVGVHRIQFSFQETSTKPQVDVTLFVNEDAAAVETYADQAHFARAYELE